MAEEVNQHKVEIRIVKTTHGNFDFQIFLDGKPRATSIDSWAKREDCERIVSDIMLCPECLKSLNDWKQAEAEHISETFQ